MNTTQLKPVFLMISFAFGIAGLAIMFGVDIPMIRSSASEFFLASIALGMIGK